MRFSELECVLRVRTSYAGNPVEFTRAGVTPGPSVMMRRSAGRLLVGTLIERAEIDGHAHRLITHAVRMQLVAGPSYGVVGYEFGLHAARLWIGGRAVEIRNAVEHAAGADECVQLLALFVL